MKELILVERIEQKICLVRGHKVMLDRDLAEMYEVPARRFNEQVKRNISRFPSDFMFRLSPEEADNFVEETNHENNGVQWKSKEEMEHGYPAAKGN